MKKVSLTRRFTIINTIVMLALFFALVIACSNIIGPIVRSVFHETLVSTAGLISNQVSQWETEQKNTLDAFERAVISSSRFDIITNLKTTPLPDCYGHAEVYFVSENKSYSTNSTISNLEIYLESAQQNDYYMGEISNVVPIMKLFAYFDQNSGNWDTGILAIFLQSSYLDIFKESLFKTGETNLLKNGKPLTAAFIIPEEEKNRVEKNINVLGQEWTIVSSISEAEIFDNYIYPIRNTLFGIDAFGAFVSSMAVMVCYIIIFRRLKKNKKLTDDLSEGEKDLTQRLEVKRVDEISILSESINKFIDMVQSVVKNISESKVNLERTYRELNTSVNNNKVSIEKSMNALLNATQAYSSMNEASGVTSESMAEINANVSTLSRVIENQAAAITQASASIEQMIGNIASVNSSVEKMAKQFDILSDVAKMGIAQNVEVNESLLNVQKSSKVLLEANKTIANVASQTNLLAMNAAIEAAHAGEAGRGFAVVADEIRKLAEESSKQSHDIGKELKLVTKQIATVVEQAQTSTEAFNKVDSEIDNTTQLVVHIKSAIEEQGIGSKQILEALAEMNSITSEVKNSSEEMKLSSNKVEGLMVGLAQSQTQLKDAFSDMDIQISNMQDTTTSLNKMNKQLGGCVEEISEKIGEFIY